MPDVLHIPTLAACFGESEDPVWVVDHEGRVRFANPAAERARGGLEPAIERACRSVIEQCASLSIELSRATHGVGVLRASPVRDERGEVVAVTIVGERRELVDGHARLHRLVQHAPALVAILRGPDHVYELVNERFRRVIPGADRLLGTSARAHRSDLVAEQFVELLDHVWRTRERYESVEVPRVVEGSEGLETLYLTFVYQPILNEGGEVEGIASVAFDVTESVLARKQVEEASRAKDDFLGTLSHELRTPLNAIVGWSHLLRTGAVQGAQTQRALEAIDRNAQAQKRLVDDLLDFSRMVSGKLDVQQGVVDVAELVAAALESIRPSVTAKRVELRSELDARPVVHGDADRLHQVVANLLSNAAKFTGPGGRIEVAVRAHGDLVELEVQDDGLGIDPSVLPHVFARFRQAEGAITRRHGGLGLGLAIARTIVEMHGGEIVAQSAGLGCGTRVRVMLPRAVDADAIALGSRAWGAEHGAAGAIPRLTGVRVLVVDDELDACSVAEAALRRAGADVRVASSAVEAMEVLHGAAIDVLVSDLGMPELDGITLIERVRALPPPASRIAAVALTGHAGAEDRVRAVDAGYDSFLAKPLDVDALARTVAQVTGRI